MITKIFLTIVFIWVLFGGLIIGHIALHSPPDIDIFSRIVFMVCSVLLIWISFYVIFKTWWGEN